jgi:signal transduction histidine kinase/ligand-binding sensor domain-containing protein
MRLLLIILFVISSFWATAQLNTIKFEHYTSNAGLSQPTVKCIQQDKQGFLWFGTIKGLNKFDGLQFTSYFHNAQDSTSLTSSHITSLFEDSRGNLWIGTPQGLNLFNRSANNFQQFRHDVEDRNSLPHNYIHDIIEDSQGYIWLATRGGLCRYDVLTNHFELFQKNAITGMVSNNVRCLYEDRNKDIWVGYFGLDGLQKFNLNDKIFTSVLFDKEELEDENGDKPPLNVTIWDIFEDSKGNFWLGTDENGLILFDRKTGDYQMFKGKKNSKGSINSETVWDIEEDDAQHLLLATKGGGLNVIDLKKMDSSNVQFTHYQIEPLNAYSINDNFLLSIYKDKDGLIWIGTKDSGINKIDKGIQKFTHFQSNQIGEENLTNKDVWSIMQDHIGNLWVGTADGLNKIDGDRQDIEYFFHTPNDSRTLTGNHIYAIYQDKNMDVWIGTDEGLNKLLFDNILTPSFIQYRQKENSKSTLSDNLVQCLLEDKKGNFWVGTANGLNLMNREKEIFERFYYADNQEANNINCLLLDKKERLWLGTEAGLIHFDPISKQFTIYKHSEGKSNNMNNNINCLFEDSQNNLWIGTNEGLNRMRIEGDKVEFKSFDRKDGLFDNTIYAIRGDRKGNLWLSTNTGLTRFNPWKKVSKNFTNRDGLQDGKFNRNASYKNWNGELFFGGTDGLNSFLPKSLALNEQKPSIILTNFVINYQPVPIQKGGQLEKDISVAEEVVLFPGDNRSFSFEFVALNYTQADKNTYAYKLENYDDTWQFPPKNRNIAPYTNIDPGNYLFRVKAANNDGVWNEEGISIKVRIQPTLFQTWYFKVGLLLLSIGLGYLIYLNRVRSLRQRSDTLEKMVKERTVQIEKQNQQLEQTVQTLKNTQAQLVVSEKMASLGQLTAGIAHEINNPINFISSNVQALKMDFQDMQHVLRKVKELEQSKDPVKLTDELRQMGKELDFELLEGEIGELLAGIERGTERTVNIVSSLRIFSRNSTDTFAMADIHQGIDSTITILNSQLNGHIVIDKKYGDLPMVRCQISRLNQVFLNVINNSIQAINTYENGEQKAGLIQIATHNKGNKILISIKDNGKGMDDATKKRIFEPFYTTKDVGEGTGLGLSISYGIIEQHNGKIEVFSTLGKGTEFLIHLPINQAN